MQDGKGKTPNQPTPQPNYQQKEQPNANRAWQKKPNQRILLKISSIKKDELPLSESGGFQKNNNTRREKRRPV